MKRLLVLGALAAAIGSVVSKEIPSAKRYMRIRAM
jgi:hypothetical protein